MTDSELPRPFVGLAPFTEAERHLFFGRSKECAIVIDNILAARVTVLFGQSGVGKSSLLDAAVIPALREQRSALDDRPHRVVAMRDWQGDPVTTLCSLIAPKRDPNLVGLSRVIEAASADDAAELFVILDQFDEYLLYHSDHRGEHTFAVQFADAVMRRGTRVHWLVSLREDALGGLDTFKARLPHLLENRLRLQHLDRRGGRAAILGPVEWYNQTKSQELPAIVVDDELIEAVLHGVSAAQAGFGDRGRGAVEGSPLAEAVEAPFLQLVMARLWKEAGLAVPVEGVVFLRPDVLANLGGCEQVVSTHLENILGS